QRFWCHRGDAQFGEPSGIALEAAGIGTHQRGAQHPLAAKQFQVAAVAEADQFGAVVIGFEHPPALGQLSIAGFGQWPKAGGFQGRRCWRLRGPGSILALVTASVLRAICYSRGPTEVAAQPKSRPNRGRSPVCLTSCWSSSAPWGI